jgi:hypothetical protein
MKLYRLEKTPVLIVEAPLIFVQDRLRHDELPDGYYMLVADSDDMFDRSSVFTIKGSAVVRGIEVEEAPRLTCWPPKKVPVRP